jgi:hypothetical protein
MTPTEGHCSRCRERPRLDGQRWCRGCLTAAQRDRRQAVHQSMASEPAPGVRRSRRRDDVTRPPIPAVGTIDTRPGPEVGVPARPISARVELSEGPGTVLPVLPHSGRPDGVPEPPGGPLAGSGDAMRPLLAPTDAMTAALNCYRRAKGELDRVTRETDWRRTCYTPAAVLAPLVAAVTRAHAMCRALGLEPDGNVTRAPDS